MTLYNLKEDGKWMRNKWGWRTASISCLEKLQHVSCKRKFFVLPPHWEKREKITVSSSSSFLFPSCSSLHLLLLRLCLLNLTKIILVALVHLCLFYVPMVILKSPRCNVHFPFDTTHRPTFSLLRRWILSLSLSLSFPSSGNTSKFLSPGIAGAYTIFCSWNKKHTTFLMPSLPNMVKKCGTGREWKYFWIGER